MPGMEVNRAFLLFEVRMLVDVIVNTGHQLANLFVEKATWASWGFEAQQLRAPAGNRLFSAGASFVTASS